MLYFRWFIFLGLTFLSILGILPTIDYYSNYFGKEHLEGLNLKKSEELKNKSLTLGLDLQGGSYLLLKADMDVVFAEKLELLLSDVRSLLRKSKISYRK